MARHVNFEKYINKSAFWLPRELPLPYPRFSYKHPKFSKSKATYLLYIEQIREIIFKE